MPRLLNYLQPLYVWLFSLDPALPQALFVSMVFFSVWLLRKLAPNQWEAFANLIYVKSSDLAWWQDEIRQLWQALPAAIIGTLYGILGTGADPIPTLKAAALALLAPVVHRVASRYKGQVGAAKPKDGGSGGTREEFTVNVDNQFGRQTDQTDVNTPPGAAMGGVTTQRVEIVITSKGGSSRIGRSVVGHMQRLARNPIAGLCLALAVLVGSACSPAAWEKQAEAADAIARVSNETLVPLLQTAYTNGGLAVIKVQPTAEDAALARTVYEAKWAPVWRSYDAFKLAHDTWQNAIDARGDPLKSALAARVAFCELRVAAAGVNVHLPDFPPLRCGQ